MGDGGGQIGAAAAQLRAGARAYAAGATERLLARSPSIETGLGTRAFLLWQGFLAQRVLELAVAVEFGEPGLFLEEVRWSFAAFAARRVESADLNLAMACLGETLEGELPAASWRAAEPAFDAVRHADAAHAPGGARMPRLTGESGHGALALRFLEAALRGEARAAVDLALGALDGGLAIEDLYEHVLMPAQKEMGTLWHLGEIGVGEEHAATEVVRTAMCCAWHRSRRREPTGRIVVVGTVADDRHDVGVRATAHLLELAGFGVSCLGADVPVGEFVQAARDQGARAVVVAATMGVHLPRARETVRALKGEAGGVRAIVGGPAFALAQGLAEKVGADGWARSPRESVVLAG